jgi:hypothetical protein
MGMAVASEKTIKPKHVAVVGTADDDRSADTRLEQANAAQDQRAHDPLSEVGFGNQQRSEALWRDEQGLNRPSRMGVHQSRPSHQLSQFTHERTGVVDNDQLSASGYMVSCDVDFAGQNNRQAVPRVADLDQRIA